MRISQCGPILGRHSPDQRLLPGARLWRRTWNSCASRWVRASNEQKGGGLAELVGLQFVAEGKERMRRSRESYRREQIALERVGNLANGKNPGQHIMRIAMIGTGYVGLVSGACFSDFGDVVTCIDRDAAKIGELQNGKIPIFEPGLDALVASNVEAGRLSFATESAAAIRAADAVFLAVGTPSRRGDGFADLSYVHDAAREIAAEMDGFTVIVIKSTVSVGTNDEVDAIVGQLRPDAD